MRVSRTVVAAIALTALSACTSPATTKNDDGSGAKVASLASAGPSPSASATSTRPRYRFDMTAADEEALWAPYNKCLKGHGYTRVDAKKAEDAAAHGRRVDSKEAAALKECEEKFLPLPEWEKDPANPKASDFARAVNKCLKAKGIRMDGDSIADSENVAKALNTSSACEREVAASKY
ncbi:hypothetical protein COUCH_30495 [Couchioplanes caeruleus]|uniref:hypothetical protein n=1 Tax=Couchioplanes caeruleus TaxID=56438 RepID=UPI0020BF96ED|nr:hypothetical protein [Couchioplanes caeruleus]UQU63307.1 hypothetical protein COUCH_30495 [Couchioplanes caeruleus]